MLLRCWISLLYSSYTCTSDWAVAVTGTVPRSEANTTVAFQIGGTATSLIRWPRRGDELLLSAVLRRTDNLIFSPRVQCRRSGFPGDLRPHALTLNAYARGRRLRAQEYVADGEVDAALERLLARPEIDYVHVRDTAAGCYDLRVERASANGAA